MSSPVPRFAFVFTPARGIVSFSGCIKLFISAVGYGVTLTCVAVACTTLRTVVAVAVKCRYGGDHQSVGMVVIIKVYVWW